MTATSELARHGLATTDGEIAVINLDSMRCRSWSRFVQDPLRAGAAEAVVEHERMTAQFLGDLSALDRLESLARLLAMRDAESAHTALIRAEIASMAHRFAEAKRHLAQAELRGAPSTEVSRIRLTIDQACGTGLDRVLGERRELARRLAGLEDLVALGALLADLGEFAAAETAYKEALRAYRDVSPFPVAWVWFQRGVLCGELLPQPRLDEAAECYRKAIGYLPRYTKARVHLAEIYLSTDHAEEAETLLVPAVASGDPEVLWRLADAMSAQGKCADADTHMRAARSGFESLLARHLLAFADHGAEFYAGSGNDLHRALKLACINVGNRPTLRAFEQAHDIAMNAGDPDAASELLARAATRWKSAAAFCSSRLANRSPERWEGAAV